MDYSGLVLNNTAGASSDPQYAQKITQLVNRFASMYQSEVGTAPGQGEITDFLHQYVEPNKASIQDVNSPYNQNQDSYLTSFINSSYQNQAKDFATQQLQAQQGQANDLANLFRTQGQKAISDTEQNLLDYQSKLFDKLRPNLITSLQSQGLLNTGGMNEAIAGKEADLANSVTGYLADAGLQNQQQANQIAFAGAAAPLQYQQSQIYNQVPYLQAQGQNALNQNYQTFLSNLDYQHQLGLIGAQTSAAQSLQPSFLRTMGQSAANSFGNSLGQWASPNPGGQNGGQSGPMQMKSLFS